MGRFHDTVIGIMKKFEEGTVGDANRAEVWGRHNGDDLRGAKNLGLTLSGTKIEGIISSASQHYREGLKTIYADNRQELSNVMQRAAATVNNGVSVKLDGTSAWTVTGTSYITALELDDGAVVKALEGKELCVTIDGKPVELKSGVRYTGKIVMEVK